MIISYVQPHSKLMQKMNHENVQNWGNSNQNSSKMFSIHMSAALLLRYTQRKKKCVSLVEWVGSKLVTSCLIRIVCAGFCRLDFALDSREVHTLSFTKRVKLNVIKSNEHSTWKTFLHFLPLFSFTWTFSELNGRDLNGF